MSEVDRIVDQMTRAFDGGAWHGPALSEILELVDAEAAGARPLRAAHNIWEIVLHLIGTQHLLLARLRGIDKQLTPDDDWPPVGGTEKDDWARTVGELRNLDRRMRDAVAAFPVEKLDEPLVAGGSSAYLNLHGYVQHNLYHAGQIAILSKEFMR